MKIAQIQTFIFLALALVAFALEAWALIDAIGRRAGAFTAEGKRTRGFWLALLAVAAAFGFLAIPPPVGLGIMPVMVLLVAVVPAGVYLADVRPAVRENGGRRGGRGRRQPPRGGW